MNTATSRWRAPLCIGLALALAGPVPGVRAKTAPAPISAKDKALAKKHFMKAQRAFEIGAHQAAYAEMQEAYRLSPIPDLLFNLGRLALKVGKKEEAIGYMERYLRERPDAADAAEVRAQLAELKGPAATPPLHRSPRPSQSRRPLRALSRCPWQHWSGRPGPRSA